MYPDFLVIRRVGEGFVIDVIEPHRADEGDAPRKVKALAEYAEKHGTLFGSVQVISKGEDGVFRRLDLNRDTVRAAAKAAPHNVVQLFVDHGEAIGTLA